MTEAQALRDLASPLIFGDVKQIAAHKFLERINECEEKFSDCEDGHSTVDAARGCSCLEGFSDEVIEALCIRREEFVNCGDCHGDGVIECPECEGTGHK